MGHWRALLGLAAASLRGAQGGADLSCLASMPLDNTVCAAGASLPNAIYQDATFAYGFTPDGVPVTYKPTGSTTGKNSIIANTVSFAGSDSLLRDADYVNVPDLQMYPAVAAAVVPLYNVPGLSAALVLDRATLPLIFLGDIRRWNDPRIAALQGMGVVLPDREISVVVRDDGSGTSEVWTTALAMFSACVAADCSAPGDAATFQGRLGRGAERPDWCEGAIVSEVRDSGFSTSGTVTCAKATHAGVHWSYTRGFKNSGVVAAVAAIEGSIGYAVYSDAISSGQQIAHMVNLAGITVAPTAETLSFALMELGGNLNERGNAVLIDAKASRAWPISTYTYFVMRKGYAQTARMRSTSADAAFAVQATGGALTREQYEAQYSCATRLQTLQYLIFFYTSDVTANIGTRLGFTTLPRFMAERLIADLAAQIYCISSPTSTFSALALAQLGPTQLVLPITQSLSRVMAPYFDTFATVDDTVRWSGEVFVRASSAFARWRSGERTVALVSLAHVPAAERELSGGASSPLIIAGVVPVFHVDGYPWLDASGAKRPLVLSVDVIAQILLGNVTRWSDGQLDELQPDGHPPLPDEPILLVTRSDSSETTSTLTLALAAASDAFRAAHGDEVSTLAAPGAPNVLVADSELATEAAVTFYGSSLGFVSLTASAVEADQIAALSTRSGSGGMVLPFSVGALRACAHASALVHVDALNSYYELGRANSAADGCWPFATSYELVVRTDVLDDECAQDAERAQYVEVLFARWLFTGEDVIKPFASFNVYAVDGALRAKFALDAIGKRCVSCAGGLFLPAGGRVAEDCRSCEAGTFRDRSEFQQAVCHVCEPGTFAEPGSEACMPCEAGTYAGSAGAGECIKCNGTYYQPDAAQTACLACPPNTRTLFLGSVERTDCTCDVHFFNADGAAGELCEPCPVGGICAGGTALPLAERHWWFADANRSSILRCKIAGAPCPGGEAETCEIGYESELCSDCSAGFYRTSVNTCSQCAPNNRATAGAGIPVMFAVAFAMNLHANIDRQGPLMRSSIAIAANVDNLIVFFQVFNLLLDIDSVWPPAVRALMGSLSFLRINLSVFSLQCAIPLDFAQNWRAAVFGPWFFVLVQVAFGVVRELYDRCALWRSGAERDPMLPGLINVYRTFNASLYAMSLLFLVSTSATFQAFACYVQPDGSTSLRIYPAIRCYSPEWYDSFYVHAVTSLCITVVGYPLLLLAIFATGFHRYEKYSAYNRMTMAVTNPYKARLFWWDGVELVRKLMLVVIIAFSSSPRTQLAACALIVLLNLYLHVSVRPYKHQNVNVVASVSMISLLVVLICGLGLHHIGAADGSLTTADENYEALVGFTVLVYVACCFVPALTVYIICDLIVVMYRAHTSGRVMNRVSVDENLLAATVYMMSIIDPRALIAQVALSIDDEDVHSQFNHAINFLFSVSCNNKEFQRTPQGNALAAYPLAAEEHRLKSSAAKARELLAILQKASDSLAKAGLSTGSCAINAAGSSRTLDFRRSSDMDGGTVIVPGPPSSPTRLSQAARIAVDVGDDRSVSRHAFASRLSFYGQTVPLTIERRNSSPSGRHIKAALQRVQEGKVPSAQRGRTNTAEPSTGNAVDSISPNKRAKAAAITPVSAAAGTHAARAPAAKPGAQSQWGAKRDAEVEDEHERGASLHSAEPAAEPGARRRGLTPSGTR